MKTWSLKTIPIKDLKNHPKNPRQLSKEQAKHLESSLSKFGLAEKPIVNLDNLIIGGHQRVALLKKKKQKTIECWVPSESLSEEEVDELNIRLNKNHGSFDYEILANQFDLADLIDWGFTTEELELNVIDNIESEDEDKAASSKEDKVKLCPHCGKDIG